MALIFKLIFFAFIGLLLFNSSCIKESVITYNNDTTIYARVYKFKGLTGKNATVESIYPDSCFNDVPYIAIFSWTNGGIINHARSFIKFDLSEIPVNKTIKAAKLFLYWSSYKNLINHTGDNSFTIYRVTENWDENTITWNTQPNFTEINKVTVPKSKSITQSYDIDVTNLVRDMINNPSQNHGIMLKIDVEMPYKLVILASSNHQEEVKRPCLVIY